MAPIYRGELGYREGLDADADGVACEPYRDNRTEFQ
ncbi:excalibur calcium-binding domain-containing protein [Sphingopyxis sp. USTB-05]|nr:excalibur calcium-binding domain-containing protein [Sphingopyxis sp. USTB-05]